MSIYFDKLELIYLFQSAKTKTT